MMPRRSANSGNAAEDRVNARDYVRAHRAGIERQIAENEAA